MAQNIDFKLNIDDRGSSQTLGQMEQKLESLNEEMKQTEVGSQRFKELQQEIQRTNSDLKTFEESMEGVSTEDVASRTGELAGGLGDLTGAFVLATGAGEEFEKSLQKGLSIAIGVRGAIESVTAASKLYGPAVRGARNATVALNAAMRANPAGAVATAIGLLVTGIGTYMATAEDATGVTKRYNEEQDRFNKSLEESIALSDEQNDKIGSQVAKFDSLTKQLQNTNEGSARRNELINEIQDKFGSYLGNLDSEEDILSDIAEARQKVIDGIFKEIQAKNSQEEIQKILNERYNREERELSFLEKQMENIGLKRSEVNEILRENEKITRDNIAAFVDENKVLVNDTLKNLDEESGLLGTLKRLNEARKEEEGRLQELLKRTQSLNRAQDDTKEGAEQANVELERTIDVVGRLEKAIDALLSEDDGMLTIGDELEEVSVDIEESSETIKAELERLGVPWRKIAEEAKDSSKKTREEFTTLAEDIANINAKIFGVDDDRIKSAITEQVRGLGGELQGFLDQQFQNRLEQIDIEKERRIEAAEESAEAELAIQKNRLEQGIITEKEFEQRKREIDKRSRLQQWKAEVKAFQQEKKLDTREAIINGAIGATETIANLGFPAALPVLPLVAAKTSAEIATIQSQQAPPRPEFQQGGIIEGPSHSRGGVPINAEGGEIILNRNVGQDPVLRDIAAGLNAVSGGNDLSSDGKVSTGGSNRESNEPVRAFVVESDITNAQKRTKRRKNRSRI